MEEGGFLFRETTDQAEGRWGEEQRLQMKSHWAGQGDAGKLLADGLPKKAEKHL